ncbi:hypothetical protein [Metamycoplasma orale]|uniref:Uncharacterized protein n=1 Tax=Metamycoplasma orale TaxID=2121 RepID=A0A448ZXF7_METOS|nr:hypothetical protein [Metamycoplasma orale]VEU55940.1 Uncharacterised protein [Metamycoplasma orale]
MKKETLDLLLKQLNKINENSKILIYGSAALYLNKLITRLPNNLDISFLYNENDTLLDYNNYWQNFISNFNIKAKLIDSFLVKKYEVLFNNEIVIINCVMSKNIFKRHTIKINNLLVANLEYSYSLTLCQLFYFLSKDYIQSAFFQKEKIKQIIDDIFEIVDKFNVFNSPEIFSEILEREYIFNFFNSNQNYFNIVKTYDKLWKIIPKYYKNIDKEKLGNLISIVKNIFENKGIVKKIENIDFILLTKRKLIKYLISNYKKFDEQFQFDKSILFIKNKEKFKDYLISFFKKININFDNENLKVIDLRFQNINDGFAFDILNLYDLIFSQENYQNDFYLYKHSQHAKRHIIILCSINIFEFLAILIVALCMFIIFKPNIKWNLNKNEIITASILSFIMVAYCVGTILFYVFWYNNFEHKKWFWGFYIYNLIPLAFYPFASFLDSVSALIIMIGFLVFFIINFICYVIIYKKINVLSFKQNSSYKLTV